MNITNTIAQQQQQEKTDKKLTKKKSEEKNKRKRRDRKKRTVPSRIYFRCFPVQVSEVSYGGNFPSQVRKFRFEINIGSFLEKVTVIKFLLQSTA